MKTTWRFAIIGWLTLAGCSDRNPKNETSRAVETKSHSEEATPISEDVTRGRTEAPDSVSALSVLEAYYDAINSKDYPRAYALWESQGAASGKSLNQFSAGFANTESVQLIAGPAGQVGAAAGSRYIDIPVTIQARLSDRTEQHFSGTYTLRRSVVDGATADQREWRIYKAHIVETGR